MTSRLIAALTGLSLAGLCPGLSAASAAPAEGKAGHQAVRPNTAEVNAPAAAQAASRADSLDAEPFPDKLPSHTTWEKVLSFPGRVLYLPFWVVFQTAGAVIVVEEKYDVYERAMDFLTADDGSYGVFPDYSDRSGLGLTFFLKDRINAGSRFDATASWWMNNRGLFQTRYRRLDLFGGLLHAGLRAGYRNLPDEKFFGLGPDSREEDETNYSHEIAGGEIAIGKNVRDRFKAGITVGFEQNIIGPGRDTATHSTTEQHDETTLPGIDEETTLVTYSAGVYIDRRNRLFRPSSGVEGEIRSRLAHETNDDEFTYVTTIADLSGYVHLFHDRIVFLRLAGQFTDPLPGRRAPFYGLAELGSSGTVRGLQRGRFRDADALLATVEYRYPVWRALDASLFADAGTVAADAFRDFESGDVQWTFGGGFTMWQRAGVLFKTEIGFGDDGFRFHFLLNPSAPASRAYDYF